MSKVLITGASGFIGGHLVEALLERGDHVRCQVRQSSNLKHIPSNQVELAYADLSDANALQQAVAGTEVVYHLAAKTSAHTVADLMAANAHGSERLAAACAAQPNPPVLVAASSIAASGPIERGQVRTENDPPAPVSNYGRSKLAAEQACRKHAGRVPTTIVRAAIVVGPRNKELLPVYKSLQNFRFHPVPTFNPPPLSYVAVDDLIRLLMRCADDAPRLPSPEDNNAPLGQGIYYGAMSEHPTFAEFGKLLKVLLDRPYAPLVHLPAWVMYPLAALNQAVTRLRGKYDTFNIDKIREATQSSWACSGAAASRDLDICLASSLEEQLQESIAWYREAGWL